MDPRTADEKYAVNPNNFSNDPDYAYHSLSWHAARVTFTERREQQSAAKIERDAARRRSLAEVAA